MFAAGNGEVIISFDNLTIQSLEHSINKEILLMKIPFVALVSIKFFPSHPLNNN